MDKIVDWERFRKSILKKFYLDQAQAKIANKPYTTTSTSLALGLGASSFYAVMQGRPCGIDTFMRICVWLDANPRSYLFLEEVNKIKRIHD